jgi:hypothetical protein
MSNPFDQFASEFQAALPPGAPGAAPPAADPSNPYAGAFADAPPPAPAPSNKPVMNAPVMSTPSYNGYGVGMGGQPQGGMGGQPQGGMGQPQGGMGQPQGQPQYDGQPQYGMGMPSGYGQPMGGPPPQYAPQMNGMGPPPPQGNDFGGYGAPPPSGPPSAPQPMGGPPSQYAPQMNGMSGPPPPQGNDFGGYGAPPPTGPPAMPQSPPHNQPSQPTQPGQFAGYGAPVPPANDSFGGYGAPAPPANDSFGGYGAPAPQGLPPQANDPFGGYGAPAPPQAPPQAPLATNDPFGGYGQAPPQPLQPPQNDPFASYGAPPAPATSPAPWGQPGADPNMGALVPSQQPNQQYSQYAPQQPPQQYAPQQPPQQYAPQQPPQQQPPPATDPFSVFTDSSPAPGPGAIVPAQAPQQQRAPPQQQAPAPANDDLWGEMGFDAPPSAGPPQAAPPSEHPEHSMPERHEHGESKEDGLPPGGEWYDARIFTPTLGVMFFKPQELTDSLFLNTERSIVDGLDERPVVAFIVEGSSARSAGVELGHVLLKVNGVDVRNPKEASRLIKEGPRPLPLLFYVPNTEVVVAEGEHMVKYDSRETTAPNSAKDWKPKYVVIGGIIAQPWMMNMYRSKVRKQGYSCMVQQLKEAHVSLCFSFFSPSTTLPSLRPRPVAQYLLRSSNSLFKEPVFKTTGRDLKW